MTFNLRPRDRLQLVFHRGAKVKDAANFSFPDGAGLLRWAAKDRAILEQRSIREIEAQRAVLVDLVNRWMLATA